jgi:hypothetical protein
MISAVNRIVLLIFSVLFSFCGIGPTNTIEGVGSNLKGDSV